MDYAYVIGSDETSLVKIGHSESPERRLVQIRTGSPWPLRVLWQHGGGQRLERALHQRFAPLRRSGEWFDFGDDDPVMAVSLATVELFDSGAVTGRRRVPRLLCPVMLNGCLIVTRAPGRWEKDWLGQPELKRPFDPWTAQCTAMADTGHRCEKPIHDFHSAYKTGLTDRMPAGIETENGWVVCMRLELDAVELDRWLRQRCSVHARSFRMWCLPEWEQFNPIKHRDLFWPGKPSESTSFGVIREMYPLTRRAGVSDGSDTNVLADAELDSSRGSTA